MWQCYYFPAIESDSPGGVNAIHEDRLREIGDAHKSKSQGRSSYSKKLHYVPFNHKGHWKIWDDEGFLVQEGDYLDGQIHGVFKFYYPNMNLWGITVYNHGEANDYECMYHENGTIKEVNKWKQFTRILFTYQYSEKGVLILILLHNSTDENDIEDYTVIYDKSNKKDSRLKYKKKLSEFVEGLNEFKNEHNLPK